MKWHTALLILLNLIVFQVGMLVFFNEKPVLQKEFPQIKEVAPLPKPILNQISTSKPDHLSYDSIVHLLKKWNQEAPELTEYGTYGKSKNGTELSYFRITNSRIEKSKPRVMIMACIHGNEPLTTDTTMWYIGALLENYDKDPEIKNIVDTRDIYFIPLVSPDSFTKSRMVENVDPNRDFPGPSRPNHKSSVVVSAIQNFYHKIKPNAVLSAHTWGHVFLIPYGDNKANCPDHESYQKIVGHMKELSGYRSLRACDMYLSNGRLNNPPIRMVSVQDYNPRKYSSIPIVGTELDWFYRNGSFSVIMEMGTHQRVPSRKEVEFEFEKTFKSIVYFIKEAPIVELKIK